MSRVTRDTLEMAEYGRRVVSDIDTISGAEFHARAVEIIRDLAIAIAGEGYDFRAAIAEAVQDAEASGADYLASFYADQR